jgi:hypothetical protein
VRVSDDGFIGLPPGMVPSTPDPNSGTVRRERPERPRSNADEIVFFPVVPGVPVPVPEVAEEQEQEPENDDETRVVARHAAPVWRLVIPGHGTVPVDGTLFLGRNPTATAGYPDAAILAINDEAKSLSKTHAMLELEGDVLWVHDLHSTNGVWIVAAGGDAVEVLPGQRAQVPAGGDLELGELAIQVEHG